MSIRCDNCHSFIWSFKRKTCKTCETAKAIVNLRKVKSNTSTLNWDLHRRPATTPPRPVATRATPTRRIDQPSTRSSNTYDDDLIIASWVNGFTQSSNNSYTEPTATTPTYTEPSEGNFGGGGASGSWDDSSSSSCSDSSSSDSCAD